MKPRKIAIIADWLTSRGGAERVVKALIELYSEADIFTSVYNPDLFPELQNRTVKTTWLQRLPKKIRNRHPLLLPFFPHAFKHLDISEYDLIISSSSAFAKHVRKSKPGKNPWKQVHICYCHSPTRYLFHAKDEYINQYPLPKWVKPFKFILPLMLGYLKKKDVKAAQKVDHFLSNSDYIGERIQKYYNRQSKTIYPCIDTKPFLSYKKETQDISEKSTSQDVRRGKLPVDSSYYLALGRFIPYKKFDLLIETFKKNKLPLKLAGKGPELERCQELAKGHDNIEFLGFIEDKNLPETYSKAKAFLFPAEEDFGLTPIESLSSGTPVIYFNRGGAIESVGKFGIAFDEQTPESLDEAVQKFEKNGLQDVTEKQLRERGESFDEKVFQKKIEEFVQSVL